MSTAPSSPEKDANLSDLGRALLGTNEGSKPSTAWVPPTAEELHQILPQYEIVKMLGRGGMGAVYMGTQTALERPVAIKILSSALEDSDAGFTQRFKNEAKAMAKLNHPGIVSVYDFGEAPGGLLYIVMEYVDGTDVAKMLVAKNRLHTEHAMAITAHVCDALAYAHERGIIHRDIKPANIMVGYDGEVKVADFGLAKVNVGGKTLGLTMSGMAMGTLHFMAPEALMLGTAVDHRADIYAVGVMLYQMLTGKLPQGMFKMPSLLVPGLDPRYDGIITKAVMEDREARYQSAREMRADLDSILTQPVVKVETPAPVASQPAALLPSGARPQRPGGRQPSRVASMQTMPQKQRPQGSLAWLWTLLVLLVLGGGAVWHFLPRSPAPVTSTSTGILPPEPATIPPVVTPSSAVASVPATTATLIETYNGHRYQFIPGALTWKEAKTKAESMGGHLATLTTKEENEWAILTYRKLLTTQNRNIWLGAIEDTQGSGWKWVTGEPFTPLGWFPGEPNGMRGGGGQVGHPFMLNLYSFKDGAVGWNDSSTHFSQSRDNLGFIVEWDAQAAPAVAADNASMPQPTATSVVTSSSTTADDNAGWVSLFNGKDLSGWELQPANFPADVFGGLIRIRGSSTIPVSGNMYYRGSGATLPQWKDFELICTVMTENNGNSGIILHAVPGRPDSNRAEGIEVQILNDPNLRKTAKHPGAESGGLQRLRSAPMTMQNGVWFQIKARVEGRRVQTWIRMPEEASWSPATDWIEPADWSPPSDRPGMKLGPSGTISLQNNPPLDGVVWFKEVKFRSLDKSAAQPAAAVIPSTPATPPAATTASATTWIDTKGRTLQAKFVRIEGGNVLLDIAGKTTPVALVSLSPESQKIARDLATAQAVPADWLVGRWSETTEGDARTAFADYLPDGSVIFGHADAEIMGRWILSGTTLVQFWPQNVRDDFTITPAPDLKSADVTGTTGGKTTRFRMTKIADVISGQVPTKEQLEGKSFDFFWKNSADPSRSKTESDRTLTSGGKVEGVDMEYRQWQMRGGKLVVFGKSGEERIHYDTFYKLGETWVMQGRFFMIKNITHVMRQKVTAAALSMPAPVTTSSASSDDGYIDLFSATEQKEWRQCGNGGITFQNGVGNTWFPGGSSLGVAWYAKRIFKDFIWKTEFRVTQAQFNSGLRLRFPTPGSDPKFISEQGYEVAVIDPDANDKTSPTGSIHGTQRSTASPLKPQGEWNTLEVQATGQNYIVTLNGQIVNRFTGSKRTEGHIGIENHNRGPVQFRNVRIKPLP